MALNVSEWLATESVKIALVEMESNTGSIDLFCNNGSVPCNHGTINCNTLRVEGGVGQVQYFSNYPYVTRKDTTFTNIGGNTVSSIAYEDIVKSISSIDTRIDSSTTLGTIQILNTDGEFDYLLDLAIEGHNIRILLGEPNWLRSTFIPIFKGVVENVSSSSQHNINFSVKGKEEILDNKAQNTTITEAYVLNQLALADVNGTFSGTVQNIPPPGAGTSFDPLTISIPAGTLNTRVPICIGKCYNVPLVLIDAYNHIWQVHDGSITNVIEVKSNGWPLEPSQYEVDYALGLLRILDHANNTLITVDIDGAADRGTGADTSISLPKNSTSWLVEWLILEKTIFTTLDIDYDSFEDYIITNPAELGYYNSGEDTVRDMINVIANSLGGFVIFDRLSNITLNILEDANELSTVEETIYKDDTQYTQFQVKSTEIPFNSISLGYKKNWAVIDNESQAGALLDEVLGANLVPTGLERSGTLAAEYTILKEDLKTIDGISAIKNQYPSAKDSDVIETVIWDSTAAETEIARRALIREKKHHIYGISVIGKPFSFKVGSIIKIYNDRFGFLNGKNVVVIGMSENVLNNIVKLEVWA